MSENKHKTKQELVHRITEVTDIRSDVVQDVLEGLIDVAIEELCSNDGHFRIAGLLSIAPESVKAYQNKLGFVPAHKRLRIKLTTLPKIMYKIQQDQFPDDPEMITADNWRDVFDHFRQQTEHGGHHYTFSDAEKRAASLEAYEASAADTTGTPSTPPQQPPKTQRKQVPNTPTAAPKKKSQQVQPEHEPAASPAVPKPRIRPKPQQTPPAQQPAEQPKQDDRAPTPQQAPQRTKPAPVAPRRGKTDESAAPQQSPASQPYNPFLEDDDDEP